MTSLREWYEQARSLAPERWESWLREHCVDTEVRAHVLDVLRAEADDTATGGDPLARPLQARLARLSPGEELERSTTEWIGKRIGAFRLRSFLGQGGMASVFLAQREGADFDQQVAIKLLRRGVFSAVEQRLFRRERQALAALSHPNIARLIDGGISEDGIAYLAMEFADGVALTRHCAQHTTGLRARLGLMRVVCDAVEAAHRALIVHRDLKPSNILVTADGTVKLLDFGIAKLLAEDDGETTRGFGALTPEYAAPEQFSGGTITTATDVYALGVLLHELLLGERPVRDSAKLPSVRAQELRAPGETRAQAPITLSGALRGDLDNILLKALQTDPGLRYASAGALAADLDAHLQGRPVSAHPPSAWYRTRKFMRRHRGGVTITAILVLGIVASLGLALWQARVARDEAARANTVRDFMVDLLRRTVPGGPQAERPDVPTLVYNAAAALPTELQEQPAVRIELLFTLGNVLRNMHDLPHSEALLREAEKIAQTVPMDSPLRIATYVELARTLLKKNDLDGAARYLDPLLQLPARSLPADIPRGMLLKIAMSIAANRAQTEQALALGREMLLDYRAACARGERCAELGFAENDFALVSLGAGHVREARELLQAALITKRRTGAPLGSIADTLFGLSFSAMCLGALDDAETAARDTVAVQAALGNSLTVAPVTGRQQVAEVLLAKEAPEEARALQQVILDEQLALGSDECSIASTRIFLARAYLQLSEQAQALTRANEAIADAAQCPIGSRLLNLPLAELVAGRAAAALGHAELAAGHYTKALSERAVFDRSTPGRRTLALAEAMRLAQALGRNRDANDMASALLNVLDNIQALPEAPLRVEAEIVRANQGGLDRALASALEARVAKIRHWPIGERLALAIAESKPADR